MAHSSTFHTTSEHLRKAEARTSQQHGGNVPAGSDVSLMKSDVAGTEKSKADVIEQRKANLPLPDQPPVASDWNSADASKVNVGSGRVQSDISYGGGSESLRGPATAESSVRVDGQRLKREAGEPNASIGRQ